MRLVSLAILGIAVPVWAQSIPKEVTYQRASDALNEKAQSALKKMFEKSPPVLPSQGTMLFIGPFLGIKMEQDGRAAKEGFTKLRAIIPLGGVNATMNSFSATNAEQYKRLASLLEKLAPRPSVRIRKLTGEEMKLVWPFISWDLTEPIFVVENDQQRWIVDFDETGTTLTWVEDLTETCFAPEGAPSNCMCAKAIKKGGDYELLFEAKKPCKDEPRGAAPAEGEPDPKVMRVELIKFLIADEKMGQRISVSELGPYVKKLFRATETFAKTETGAPTALTVTVAIKPGGEQRIWADAEKGAKLPEAKLRALEAALRKEGTPDPRELIAFQILIQLWGGEKKDNSTFPSVPAAWQPVLNRKGAQEAETLILEAWQ